MSGSTTRPAAAGAQTLARGLAALRAVSTSRSGLTVQELSQLLDVHRTIAYRVLSTLVEADLVSKGDDGRYRGAIGLLDLRAAGYETIKHVAEPALAALADELGATVSLLVAVQDEAVALLVLSPRAARYHVAFAAGSRHPLDRGAAGHALRAALPPVPGENESVAEARAAGYAITFGEVEPGAWGLAAPIPLSDLDLVACVNVITHREDVIRGAAERVKASAHELARKLLDQH